MTDQQHPSPVMIFDEITAYQRSRVLKGAIDLELFTAIGEGNRKTPEIAKRCSASERGIRIICDYLATAGFLTKEGSDYGLTLDTSVFLDKRSPAYLGRVSEFLLSSTIAGAFDDIAAAVRNGGTVLPEDGSVTPDHPVWVDFARGMGSFTAGVATEIAKLVMNSSHEKIRVLDIAAGHGKFGVAFAEQNPNAEIVALDWPSVLEVAQETADEAGVANRFSKLPGSAFDVEFGDNYDVILLTNFLHHFDVETCEGLLRKVNAALKPNGVAVTLEFIPDKGRVSPPNAAMFSMVMLASTPKGDAYTLSEFESMFSNAGFASTTMHEFTQSPERLLISKK